MGGSTGNSDVAARLTEAARSAMARSQWLEALDLAAQALAHDAGNVDAAALVGEARRQLTDLSRMGGELRQMTVLFCDLVGSTSIAARLGPERMRQLLLELYEVCADAVTRYGGRVAQYLGDGVLAHFGHPIAHEDDARRAVLAALAVLDSVSSRAASWKDRFDERVEVRMAIDTGMVAVGPVGSNPWSAEEIAGDPPNLAARVQGTADPMTVRVTAATARLVEGWFELVPVGPIVFRGYPRPVEVSQVARPTEAETRSEARRGPQPAIVGRARELSALRYAWAAVTSGERRVVTLVGDPGLGKSRLIEQMVATAVATGSTHVTLVCSRLHGGTVLHPVVRALSRFFGQAVTQGDGMLRLDAIRARLEQLDNRRVDTERAATSLAALLGVATALDLAPDDQRRQSFESLIDLVEALARTQPLLLSVDDVDAADPSTVELLTQLLIRPPVPMLVLATGRSGLPSLAGSTLAIELAPLAPPDAEQLVRAVAPGLDAAAVARIVARADGVPFHLEELARSAQEGGGSAGRSLQLQGFVAARLDELGPELRRFAGEIAVIGDEVPVRVLPRVCGIERAELDRMLLDLSARRVIIARSGPEGEVIRFRHALLREAAYAGLLESRRAELHGRVAVALAELPSAFVRPNELGYHHELAGNARAAARAWAEAGERAAGAGAIAEAIGHFRRSQVNLESLPPGPERDGLGLTVHFGLGTALSTTEGYTSPAAKASFERAVLLGECLEDSPAYFPAVWGTWTYWFVLGEHGVAVDLAARCLRIAEENRADIRLRWAAAAVVGYQELFTGGFARARDELHLASRHIGVEPVADFPQDPGVVCWSALSVALWFLGDIEASRAVAADAQAAADAMDPGRRRTALSQAWSACNLAWRAELDGDAETALTLSERAAAIAGERGYLTWAAAAMLHKSIAHCSLGRLDEGLPVLAAMVEAWRTPGRDAGGRQLHPVLMTPYFAGRLAEATLRSGDQATAATSLEALLAATATSGERFWDAELLRLRACVTGDPADLDRAAALAAEQGARSLADRVEADRHRAA